MRGTKCLEQLEVSRPNSLLTRTDRKNSPVEGLLPNCTLRSLLSAPCISFSQYRRPLLYSLRDSCLHLSERDSRSREVRVVLDHVRQLSCRLPGHLVGGVGAQGPKALAGTTGGRGGGASEAREGPIDGDGGQAIGSGQWQQVYGGEE
jgi:hypothetical protein